MQKEKLQRDTGSVLWGSQRFHTYEKEVNKWIWEGVWGSWTQGIGTPWTRAQRPHPDPQRQGQAQQEGQDSISVTYSFTYLMLAALKWRFGDFQG